MWLGHFFSPAELWAGMGVVGGLGVVVTRSDSLRAGCCRAFSH
jgi:hypothetical protein